VSEKTSRAPDTESGEEHLAVSKPQVPEYKSYGDIVWEQFKKYKLSYYSLIAALGLFVMATVAPLIALNVPFFISVPAGVGPEVTQGLHFPWFGALFDMNFFESGVDIFFNFLLFALPAAWLGWKVVERTRGAALDKQDLKALKARYMLGAAGAIMVGFVAVYMADLRQPYVNYVELAQQEGVSSLFPPFKVSYRDVDLMSVGQGPSLSHLLGTDPQGRDVFTRMLYGTRISLTIGVLAVGLYTFIGMLLGGLAGYFGGRVDMLVLRLIEVMICFPSFFLILTLRGFVEKASVFHIMIIIGLTGWTGIARLVRAEFLRLRKLDFVQAAIALGLPQGRIIFRHVMPNALGPVLVSATFGVAGAIITEASLSFLGLGPTTAPSWGQILDMGRGTGQWTLILVPGFAIFVTVSLLNLVGEGFRDAIDPKMRR
jgi:peptide/nickel transport system permease protein